jgi:hypothetical protein
MNKLKAKQPKEASSEASDLETRIKAVCADAEAYIETKVDALKASDEGRSLPRTWLDLNLRATTRGGGCNCKVALSLLKKESNNG